MLSFRAPTPPHTHPVCQIQYTNPLEALLCLRGRPIRSSVCPMTLAPPRATETSMVSLAIITFHSTQQAVRPVRPSRHLWDIQEWTERREGEGKCSVVVRVTRNVTQYDLPHSSLPLVCYVPYSSTGIVSPYDYPLEKILGPVLSSLGFMMSS